MPRKQAPADLALEARTALGLTQRAFARRLDTRAATVADWERGSKAPTQAALALFRMILAKPETFLELHQDPDAPAPNRKRRA